MSCMAVAQVTSQQLMKARMQIQLAARILTASSGGSQSGEKILDSINGEGESNYGHSAGPDQVIEPLQGPEGEEDVVVSELVEAVVETSRK